MATLTSPSSTTSTTLGDNVTVTGTVTECRNATSCNVAVVVVQGVRSVKVSIAGGAFSSTVQTVANARVQCDPTVICIRQTGPYRVSVWIANETIANGTEDSIGASGHPTIPADASVPFFVSAPEALSANLSSASAVVGDVVTVAGTVAKATLSLGAWAFDSAGTLSNGYCYYRNVTVTDGAFTWTLDRTITGRPGTWTVVVLSPGSDQVFRLSGDRTPPYANVGDRSADNRCSNAALLNKDGSQVLATLKAAADPQLYDDEVRVFALQVSDIFLRLDPLTTAYLNDTLTVSGRTSGNGTTVLVSVAGSTFEKQQTATISGGVFSASFDTTVSNNTTWPWTPGKYTVRAVGPEGKSDTLDVELVAKRPAEFKVDNLVVLFSDGTAMDGRVPAVGQTMTASATLINKGETEANATLDFQLSGRTLCAPTVPLKGGQYVVATCNFTVNYTGTYTLQADGKSVILNVRGPKLPEVAGETKSIPSLAGGAQARILFSGAVDQVVLQARSPLSAAEVISQPLDERPEGAAAPPGTPFRYFRLSSVNLPDAAVGSMNVVFRVDGAWLAEKKMSPGTVRLYRLAAPSAGGAPVWRVESGISELGTDKRADGSSDVLYQAKVTAFGDFAVVGGSTEGAISAPGEAGPLAIFANIPVMAAIAAGAGFFVFAWRKGWIPFLKRKKVPEGEAAPGVLTAGEAEALPRTYEDEILSLFQSGQMVQAFKRLFDEVAGPLKAALGAEGTLSSGELMQEAESKGLDPTLLTTLGQLFATCDAARFSGIPPTEEHLKWALRAARSVFARLSGGGALPASTGRGAVPEAAGPVPGTDYGAGVPEVPQPGVEPGPRGGPEGGYEAADLPPEGEAPPEPEAPGEPKNGNGNGNRRRRKRRGGGGNGNGDGGHGGGGGNGNGNGNGGNGHHGNGNGNGGAGRQAAGSPALYGASVFTSYGKGGFYLPSGGGNFSIAPPRSGGARGSEADSSAPPPATGGLVVQRMEKPPSPGSGTAMSAYASFQRGLVPSPGQPDAPALPVPPLSPRPKLPGPNGNGHNGTNGHGTSGNGTNGTNGHGTNGGTNGHGHNGTNGHGTSGNGTNGHGTNGTNGHGTNGESQPVPKSEPDGRAPERPARAAPARPPVALDRATVAALMAAEMRKKRRAATPSRPLATVVANRRLPSEGADIPGIGGRTTPTPDGSGAPRSASPSTPPPSLSPPAPRAAKNRHPEGAKYEPAPYPFTREE